MPRFFIEPPTESHGKTTFPYAIIQAHRVGDHFVVDRPMNFPMKSLLAGRVVQCPDDGPARFIDRAEWLQICRQIGVWPVNIQTRRTLEQLRAEFDNIPEGRD